MKGLGRSGGDLGREGQGLGFHGARVSQSRWPVRWRQVLVGYGGATKEPRAQEKKREGDDSGSWVLAGDASDVGWRRRRRVSPAVGLAAVAPAAGVLVVRWLEILEKELP